MPSPEITFVLDPHILVLAPLVYHIDVILHDWLAKRAYQWSVLRRFCSFATSFVQDTVKRTADDLKK
jgi:hypothetical protein